MSFIKHVKYIFFNFVFTRIIDLNVLFLYNKKQCLNSMKIFLETLNKRRQFVPYLYTCKLNKMAVPWRYPLRYTP